MELQEKFLELIFNQFNQSSKIKRKAKMKAYEDFLNARRKYRESVGELRYGDFNDLELMTSVINNYIINKGGKDKFDKQEAIIIKELIAKLNIDYDSIHPYELPILFDFRLLCKMLDDIIGR